MITGIGIPSSQSSSPLPIVRFLKLLRKKGAIERRLQCIPTWRRDYAATATSIQLHLAVANEIREPLVPVAKRKTWKIGKSLVSCIESGTD